MEYLMDIGDLPSMDNDMVKTDDDIVNRDDDIVNRNDYIVNRDDDIINRDDDIVNRDDDIINRDDDIVKTYDNGLDTNEDLFPKPDSYQSFDPKNANFDQIIGEPSSDMEHWHQQSYHNTCAVASQEFILDELTGQDFSENDLRQEAIDNGWYTPGRGTSMYNVGELLEAHGIDVERGNGFTVEDLSSQLEQGHKVIVGLDADEIRSSTPEDEWIGDYPGMPGQGANHAVQVIGIDNSDPNNPMVILNDPGHPAGQGMMVPLERFEDAWADSDHFMVHTTGLSTAQSMSVNQLDNPMLGGYYNADGTYHWVSDQTDRDPETGAIIRRW